MYLLLAILAAVGATVFGMYYKPKSPVLSRPIKVLLGLVYFICTLVFIYYVRSCLH